MVRLAAAFLILATPVFAEPVGIDADRLVVTVETPDGPVEIMREQDTDAVITGDFARTSRACPPFCIQPMTPAAGVTTIGELELLDMLEAPEAVVIDSRTRDWFEGGTIPGSVHIPWDQITDRLAELNCEPDFEGWDCSEAVEVALFCNGPWCGQSPTAIRAMIGAGYPADKISYYRGGMQLWRLLGLTVVGAR
jgi:rhodanese-related sulfurtransferase